MGRESRPIPTDGSGIPAYPYRWVGNARPSGACYLAQVGTWTHPPNLGVVVGKHMYQVLLGLSLVTKVPVRVNQQGGSNMKNSSANLNLRYLFVVIV